MTAREIAVLELAEDWLAVMAAKSQASSPENSDRARRSDLARWGRALAVSRGQALPPRHRGSAPVRPGVKRREYLSLDDDLGWVTLGDLTVENLGRALGVLRRDLSPASVRRAMTTMRTWCRWLVKKGYLPTNVADDEDLHLPAMDHAGVGAVGAEDLDALLETAEADPPPGSRAWWPTRDVAVVRTLAYCGLRVSELCGLRVGDLDHSERASVVSVSRGTKGSKSRKVPMPEHTAAAVTQWLLERRGRLGEVSERDLMFVKNDGSALTPGFVYRLSTTLASRAGVVLPKDAAVHGFRHYYGVQLALRRVPLPVIQNLMGHVNPTTTAVYTNMAGHELIDPLDEAGWL